MDEIVYFPFHIKEIAKLFPIISSVENNLADGRIEQMDAFFRATRECFPKPGAYLPLRSNYNMPSKHVSVHEVWVHLGNGYFKQVLKRII